MTIETKLDFKRYLELMFAMAYRKPIMIVYNLLGLILLTLPLIYFLGGNISYDKPPYFQLVFAVFILALLPFSVYTSAKKNFASPGKLREKIIYEITEENILMTGETFELKIEWDKIHKIMELKKWVLIYPNKKAAFILPKEDFGERISDFRTLVRSKRFIQFIG